MPGKKKWIKKSFFSEMIRYFVLLLLVPMLTIMLIFNRADDMLKAQIQESATKDMRLYYEQVEKLVRDMQETALNVWGNSDCRIYSQLDTEDYLYTQQIKRNIQKHLEELIDIRYRDIFVYFERDGMCISGQDTPLTAEQYYDAYYGEFGDGKYLAGFMDMLKTTSLKGSCHVFRDYAGKEYFCVAFHYSRYGHEDSGYTICVVLSQEHLKQTLIMGDISENSSFQIYNQNQQLILENAPLEGDRQIILDVLENELPQTGEWIERGEYMLQKQKSELMGNTYMYVVLSESYWNARQELRVFCYLGISICAVLSVLLAYRNAKKAYRPVKTMMNLIHKEGDTSEEESRTQHEFERIKSYINSSEIRMREYRKGIKDWNLYHLLEGKFSDEDREELEKNGVTFSHSRYAVCLLQIEEIGPKIEDLYLFVIKNVLEELGNAEGDAYLIEISKNRCVLLMNFDGDEESVGKVLQEGTAFLNQHFGIVMTVGRSRIHEQIDEIAEAYREAQEAARYRFLTGVGSEIHYDEIANKDMKRRSNESRIYMLLQDCVREERTPEEVEQFVERLMHIYEINEEVSMDLANYFKREVITSLGNLMAKNGIGEEQRTEINGTLMRADTLADFSQILMVNLSRMCEKSSGKKEKDDLCVRVKAYIDENYSDSELSVSMLGKEMGVQPSYLSRQFKDRYGISMLDYIASVRIAKAKELIGVQRMSIADTASAVGFSDGLTFNRNFKKFEGIAPAEYKKSCEN